MVLSRSVCPAVCDPRACSPPRSCPWNSPGKKTVVGSHFLLQVIFPTQGSNLRLLCLLYCQVVLYHCATWKAPTQKPMELALKIQIPSSRCLEILYQQVWGLECAF